MGQRQATSHATTIPGGKVVALSSRSSLIIPDDSYPVIPREFGPFYPKSHWSNSNAIGDLFTADRKRLKAFFVRLGQVHSLPMLYYVPLGCQFSILLHGFNECCLFVNGFA
jgi:hypothetical protein